MGIAARLANRIAWEKQRLRLASYAAQAPLGRYRDVVWLLGEGRSGTTWTADLINADGRMRVLFEPVHPFDEPQAAASGVIVHEYIRPSDDGDLRKLRFILKVLAGRHASARADHENRLALWRGLLVKDIFANLLARWAFERARHVRPILLIRNPFSVALSKARAAQMRWMDEPGALLAQTALVEDHLGDRGAVLENCDGDFISRQIFIWCVANFVPLRQFRRHELLVVFYENLYLQPNIEMRRIFAHIGQDATPERIRRVLSVHGRSSKMTTSPNTLNRGSGGPLHAYRTELSAAQIDGGLRILDAFGLGALYMDDGVPNPSALAALQPASFHEGASTHGHDADAGAVPADRSVRSTLLR